MTKDISTQVPEELHEELEAYADSENFDESAAVRTLLADQLEEWRTQQALERLDAGEVTLSGGAEIAGKNVWNFAERAEREDVTLVSDDHLETDLRGL